MRSGVSLQTRLPVLQNPLSLSVRSLIDRLNSQVPCTRKVSAHERPLYDSFNIFEAIF